MKGGRKEGVWSKEGKEEWNGGRKGYGVRKGRKNDRREETGLFAEFVRLLEIPKLVPRKDGRKDGRKEENN